MKPARKKITDEQRNAAVVELRNGARAKDIAARFGISTSAVQQWSKSAKRRLPVAVARPEAATIASRDATIFLRKAKSELMAGIRSGRVQDLDSSHLLALLALHSLQGGGG